MSETAPAVGRSYGEIVVHAFRKNLAARVALWISALMILVAVFTPLLANDRPFAFKGSLPGEYRRAALAAGRGAVPQIIGLPARLAADTARFEKGEASLNDLLRHVTDAEGREIFDPLERLRKRAEGMPDIRGRWVSRDVTLAEILVELTPEEKPAFERARARILRDLPATYADRLRTALAALEGRLEELSDQAGPATRGPALAAMARIREAAAPPYLTSPGDRKAALQEAGQAIRELFDPEKTAPIEQWRFPLLASLDTLDALFILGAIFGLLAFGPLTWWKLKRIAPIERRWSITWAIALAPALLLSGAWSLVRETKFETVSYKKGLTDGSVKMSSAVWPPCRYRYDEVPEDQSERLVPPSAAHPFGTDYMGRDLLSRMLWGSRISLSIGFTATLIAVLIGVVLGALAGFFRGWVDIVLSRFIEIMICFPRFFIILAVVAFLPPNIFYVMLALGVFGWMGIARLQRGEFLRLRHQDFVSAAQALGATNSRVMFRHILPNGLAPVLVASSFSIAGAMLTESALSFLGLGVQDPATSWGQILYTGRSEVLQGFAKWWSFTIPGAAIFLAVTCYNLVGDGIRDAVDPRLKT